MSELLGLRRIYDRARTSRVLGVPRASGMQHFKPVMIRGPYGIDILSQDGHVLGFIELRKAAISPATWFARGLSALAFTDQHARTSIPERIRLWDPERGWYTLSNQFLTLREALDWFTTEG